MDASRPFLTVRETVGFLALSTRTIHRFIVEAKLEAYRVGGEKTIGIKREDIEGLLEFVRDKGSAVHTGVERQHTATKNHEDGEHDADG